MASGFFNMGNMAHHNTGFMTNIRNGVGSSRGMSVSSMTTVNGEAVVVIGDKTFRGKNVVMRNNKIFIDGREITDEELRGDKPEDKDKVLRLVMNVTVQGDVEKMEGEFNDVKVMRDVNSMGVSFGTVTVHGDVKGSIQSQSGNVIVEKNVGGDVKTMSGSIDVGGNVAGSASTMSGNIHATRVATGSSARPTNDRARPQQNERSRDRDRDGFVGRNNGTVIHNVFD